jgi:hypothetical protein
VELGRRGQGRSALQGQRCAVGSLASKARKTRIFPGGNMGKHKKIERMKEIGRRRKRREERLKERIREAKAAVKSK